jgi:NRPS condensation-like uncharacterized protein
LALDILGRRRSPACLDSSALFARESLDLKNAIMLSADPMNQNPPTGPRNDVRATAFQPAPSTEQTAARPPRRRFPLSVAEEIFLAETTATPATMQFELRVSGSIDDTRLREAITRAATVHPMTQVRLVGRRFLIRPPRWEMASGDPPADILQSIHCDDETELDVIRSEYFSRPIALGRAPAIRALLIHRSGGDTLMFSIHHSLMDGMGGLRWINSVARAYAGRADPVPAIDPIAARDLKRQFGSNIPPGARVVQPKRAAGGGWARVWGPDQPETQGYGVCHASLTAKECERLQPCRHGQDATINDLLIAALHATVAAWNESRNEKCDVISILMPVNLRPAEWNTEVVANLVLTTRNISAPAERATPAQLMQCVTAQMDELRGSYLKVLTRSRFTCWLISNVLLPCLLWWPKVAALVVPETADSIFFTSLGRIERKIVGFGKGGGALTEFWISPPIKMPMGLAIDATILRGQIFVSLRYCLTRFDSPTAQTFCELYVSTLRRLGGAGE